MHLTNNELKKYYFGAYDFAVTDDGYLQAFQYSAAQIEYFKHLDEFFYDRCTASTSKTLEFITTATEISFDYKIIWRGSDDTFELTIDGLITQIYNLKDMKDEGRLTFTLPEGNKRAVIYLPADATVLIKDLSINADATAPVKNTKVLWLGDSITQGYGTLRSAETYVSIANRLLDYDIINQGIGGYVYDKGSLMKMDGYTPDKLIVALGTNQFGDEDLTPIEEYYVRLFEIYGHDIPTLVITPLWRGDVPDGEPTLIKFCDRLKSILKTYPNITIVDGFSLIPHLSEYYLDDLHPNPLGAEVYANNLVNIIRRVGF
ncbi:MAG: SGNH/GDSL hydrolase family protein [Lachnospiraceae bacterium]|nr:SGNH/GDSL hydrolase family protein [Lachnospiraceae bacterium]